MLVPRFIVNMKPTHIFKAFSITVDDIWKDTLEYRHNALIFHKSVEVDRTRQVEIVWELVYWKCVERVVLLQTDKNN